VAAGEVGMCVQGRGAVLFALDAALRVRRGGRIARQLRRRVQLYRRGARGIAAVSPVLSILQPGAAYQLVLSRKRALASIHIIQPYASRRSAAASPADFTVQTRRVVIYGPIHYK